ncbi:tripartite tricarboxylate transporter substrate binding protein [Devosia sp. YIM 151766]|uniref:Bug family tripartite tricarboxylate transporter substrate binding protein n=1 Tax=Devosia sp. YIM 151766 TaxID=3017325 RepID=UPI00255C4C2A|nr:tripartite tricarboxylate transporter substrate binding protein [Devosia sp. YIM 151766]WIY53220.1 tripartite tricarboxylate transporter substrate binding protein [Devosia sp. YIM 151766]
MTHYTFFTKTIALAGLLGVAFTASAMAQDAFPSKDITFVVQAAAGGASDRTSRAIASELEKDLGVSVIVENRPGASGTVAFAHVAEQPADGYTIGFGPVEFAIAENIGYDFDRADYTYLGQVMNSPVVLAVAANSPYDTLEEFIEAAKTTELSVSNSGAASAFAATAFVLAQMTGAQITPVPFDGGAPAVAAALGNHVDAVTAGAGETATAFADGSLKVLAIFDEQEHPRFPGVKTAAEQGYDLSFGAWGGVYGPAGIPDDAKAILEESIKKAAASQTFLDAVTPAGILPAYKSGDEWKAFVDAEAARYAEVLK